MEGGTPILHDEGYPILPDGGTPTHKTGWRYPLIKTGWGTSLSKLHGVPHVRTGCGNGGIHLSRLDGGIPYHLSRLDGSIPPQSRPDGGNPTLSGDSSRPSTCYVAGGMPLAFTHDFLVTLSMCGHAQRLAREIDKGFSLNADLDEGRLIRSRSTT